MAQALTGFTKYTQQMPTQTRQRRFVLGPVVVLVVLAFFVLVAIGIVQSEVGPGGVLLGALLALLPVGPVVAAFLWIYRWEPEQPHLLLSGFVSLVLSRRMGLINGKPRETSTNDIAR